MKQNKPVKLCYVYLQPLKKENEDFTTIVPLRSARMMKGIAEIHIIYRGSINEEKLNKHGINCHRYQGLFAHVPVLFYVGLVFFIRKIRMNENITIFQNVWSHYMIFPISLAAKMCNANVIARIAGIPIKNKKYKNPIKQFKNYIGRLIEKYSLRSSDLIITLSGSLKQEFVNRGVSPDKMVVLSQGVDTQKFIPSEKMDNKPLNILYVGRLSALKGLDNLLAAYKEISKGNYRQSKLIIAGDADHETKKRYTDKVHHLNLDTKVKFLGLVNHDDLTDIYQNCSLLVLPSFSEGLPNVMLEAMAAGLPCIGTSVGEIPCLLADGRGIVVEPGNQPQLVRAVTDIFEERVKTKVMTEKARDYIVQNHSFESLRKSYKRLFRKLPNQNIQ